MISSRAKRRLSAYALALASTALVFATEASACSQDRVAAYVRDLSEMSSFSEKSIRYLVPMFRDCGQAAIASELETTPEWLASMRQELQSRTNSVPGLRETIDKGLADLGKAESTLQQRYELVLGGIDSMYDTRFPPKCRRERNQVVSSMKAVRPMVPDAIRKLNEFKACLAQ